MRDRYVCPPCDEWNPVERALFRDDEGRPLGGPAGDPSHGLADLADALRRRAAWIAGSGPVAADDLAVAPELRVVARHRVGADAVDLAAARARRTRATDTPGT